jgi:hypothetical protein
MKYVPNQNAAHGRLVLLAPPEARIPGSFDKVESGSRRHEHFLHSAQRLRAKLYHEDGAIRESEISWDGRHQHPADESAWHVLSLDGDGEVCGCSRYIAYPNTVHFSQLGVRNVALAHSIEWAMRLRGALDSEVAEARRRGLAYVEVGGWALDSSMRRTAEAVRIALATYSLARLLGGCLGLATATKRHCSAAILRKIGGRALRIGEDEIPPYYDPNYECEMELLRFDSAEPNPRYEPWIEDLRSYLADTLVLQAPARDAITVHEPPQRQVFRRDAWRFGQDLLQAVQ